MSYSLGSPLWSVAPVWVQWLWFWIYRKRWHLKWRSDATVHVYAVRSSRMLPAISEPPDVWLYSGSLICKPVLGDLRIMHGRDSQATSIRRRSVKGDHHKCITGKKPVCAYPKCPVCAYPIMHLFVVNGSLFFFKSHLLKMGMLQYFILVLMC